MHQHALQPTESAEFYDICQLIHNYIHAHICAKELLLHIHAGTYERILLSQPFSKPSLIQCRRRHLRKPSRLCDLCLRLEMLLRRRTSGKLTRQTWNPRPRVHKKDGEVSSHLQKRPMMSLPQRGIKAATHRINASFNYWPLPKHWQE